MKKMIQYMHPDDFFSQKTKELFLQIPHTITNVHPKVNIINFEVEENSFSPLFRNNMVQLISSLTEEEKQDNELMNHLYSTESYLTNDIGFFIDSNHGSSVQNFIRELYKHDSINASIVMQQYYEMALECHDIIKIQEKTIRQYKQLKKYLRQENIEVKKIDIDLVEASKKSEDEQEVLSNELYKQYGEGERFPAYNDLDYTPFIYNNELYIYDSSGARLYLVKEEGNINKIYMIYADRLEINISEWFSDFAYDHKQTYLILADFITEADLIGEIKDDVLVKASYELIIFDLIQSCIVETLYDENKIENLVQEMSFEELLENYTLQKEVYNIQERAFIDIFEDLIVSNGVLTYKEFSLMDSKEKKLIRHEELRNSSLEQLRENIAKNDALKLREIPDRNKVEIIIYLEGLIKSGKNNDAEKLVDYIKSQLEYSSTKMKIK